MAAFFLPFLGLLQYRLKEDALLRNFRQKRTQSQCRNPCDSRLRHWALPPFPSPRCLLSATCSSGSRLTQRPGRDEHQPQGHQSNLRLASRRRRKLLALPTRLAFAASCSARTNWATICLRSTPNSSIRTLNNALSRSSRDPLLFCQLRHNSRGTMTSQPRLNSEVGPNSHRGFAAICG